MFHFENTEIKTNKQKETNTWTGALGLLVTEATSHYKGPEIEVK